MSKLPPSHVFSTAASKSVTLPTVPTSTTTSSSSTSTWRPSDLIALYAVHALTDVRAPDFWAQVAEGLSNRGVFHSEEECQQRWFEVRCEIDAGAGAAVYQ